MTDRERLKEIAARLRANVALVFHDPKLRELREREREHLRALLIDAEALDKLLAAGGVDAGDADTLQEHKAPPTAHRDAAAPMKPILDAIKRGVGRFALATVEGKPMLFAGAHRAVRVPNGYIVALGLSRAHLEELRERVAKLITEGGPS